MNPTTIIYTSIFLLLFVSCSKQNIQPEDKTQEQAVNPKLKAATIGSNYYVSPNGSNTNPGTEAQPFLTIAYAQTKVVAGDVVIVENGTYTTSAGGEFGYLTKSGSSSGYITYKARNKGKAILDGQNNSAKYGFGVNGSYINIEGFELKGMSDDGIVVTGGAANVNFRDLTIHDIGRRCIETTNGLSAFYLNLCSYITIERCLISNIGRFAPGENGCVLASNYYQGHDHAVYCDGADYVTIKNNVFYNILRGFSLQIYSGTGNPSSNVSFVNNTCENGNPFQYNGHVVIANSLGTGLIANNIFKDQLDYAIRIYQNSYNYSNVLITKNMTSGGNGITTTGTATGITTTDNYNSTDPLFVNETNHNYALQSSSPANNTGYATMITSDFLNNTRPLTNIGAYASSIPPPPVYYSIEMSATATKNDCGTGYTGSEVTYTIPAKYYSSTVSQSDADNIAITRLKTNTQAYANAKGTCTIIPSLSIPPIIFYNTQLSATVTKNDCGTGYTGSSVTYIIPANKYSSDVSQVDADNKALADLNTNKQTYANANGSCAIIPQIVYYSIEMSATATKNDCGTGYTGSVVTYTIPAKYYSSTVSQVEADNIAITRLRTNTQAYANAKGTCTPITSTVYYSIEMSATATKNDCGTGYTGSVVNYTIPDKYYSSTVSQADANNIAIARLRTNTQVYANAKGTCILSK